MAYIIKRIDRNPEGKKMHQITDAFDKYKSSVEKVGKATRKPIGHFELQVYALRKISRG